MRRPGRLWFKDYCGGVQWEHRLVPYDVLVRKAGGDCHAYTDEAEHTVYYYEEEPDDSLGLLYCHELFHRIGLIPAKRHETVKIFGTEDPVVFEDREESAATFYGGVYWETMRPYVRLPKPPRKKKRTA